MKSGKTNGDIEHWDVENDEFWERSGKKIANRNLWISIPSLLMGFAVWMMWGMITTQMQSLGFPFSVDQLFMLTAIAGLAGATMMEVAAAVGAFISWLIWE